MSHVRQDTLTPTSEWAKHLKPDGKRCQAKRERRAARKDIKRRKAELEDK